MDVQAIFLLLAAGQGSFLTLALLSRIMKQDYFRFFAGVIFYVLTVELWMYFGFAIGYIQTQPFFPFWELHSYFWFPPAINYLLRHLSKPATKVTRTDLLSLIPGALEVVVNVSNTMTVRFSGDRLFDPQHVAYQLMIHIVPIVWTVIVLAIRFRRKAPLRFQVVYGLFAVLTVIWIANNVFPGTLVEVVHVVVIAVLFVFGYLPYLRPSVFEPPKYSKLDAQYEDYDHDRYLRALNNYMVEEKGYAGAVTLNEVAKSLEVPTKYLSYLINNSYKMNFKQWLNQLRVEAVKQQIDQGELESKTLLGVALDAGFNSKASFNAVFKSTTGQTPSEYVKNRQKA